MNLFQKTKKILHNIADKILLYFEKQQAIEMQQSQQQELQRQKAIENYYSNLLRKLWANALNTLPNHIKISSCDISPNALNNQYIAKDNGWMLLVSVNKNFNSSQRHHLKSELMTVFKNIKTNAEQEFNEKRIELCNEFEVQKSNSSFNNDTNNVLISSAARLQNNYTNYYKDNFYKLYQPEIDVVDGYLKIEYTCNTKLLEKVPTSL